MIWTAAQIEYLHVGISRGLSASLIGLDVGKTRNAVMGKAWRIGIKKWRSDKSLHIPITPEIRSKSWESRRRNRQINMQLARIDSSQAFRKKREPTKSELRTMLAQAVRYTASLPIPM
jgi:hypothetical protein